MIVSDGVRLIRAPNPSAMTFTGTNTWLVGEGDVAVIDPGPKDDGHLAAILGALRPGERITRILLTHAHLDHVALAPALAARASAPVCAWGGASAAPVSRPDVPLADGDVVQVGDRSLRAIHTPGHRDDHLCFAWGDLCFSGDHVMGWSSSVVSPPEGDMSDYLQSLAKLGQQAWSRLLPGHGAPIEDPAARLADLARHRRAREAQILDALHGGPLTVAQIADRLYRDTPATLGSAARQTVLAHLIDLARRDLAVAGGPPEAPQSYRLR